MIKRCIDIFKSILTLTFKGEDLVIQDYVNLQSVVDLFESKEKILKYYSQSDYAAQAIKNKTRLKIEVNELKFLPPESLGFNLYKHIASLGDHYSELSSLPAQTDYDYIAAHLYESHDVWHAVLGLDTSIDDEVNLQAFLAAQSPGYLFNSFCILHLIGVLFSRPLHFKVRCRALYQFHQSGKKAKHLFGVDWNKFMSKDVNLVRVQFGISL
jgi:ubiquinone biosynthesis protein COQ4